MAAINGSTKQNATLHMTKRRGSDFQDRFKGRTSLMNKEGHIGVVAKPAKPINKEDSSRNGLEA